MILTIFLLFLFNTASAFDVKPANVSDEELDEIIKNDVADEVKVSFWDLPLWIKIHHIVTITLAALGIWKFAPIILARIKSLLENRKRQHILKYLAKKQGVSIKELEESLNINRSTLRYHIDLLEEEELILSIRFGNERLIFLKNSLSDNELKIITALRSGTRRRMLELLVKNGSLTTAEIAESLNISSKTVHYHLNHLKNSGVVEVKREKQNVVRASPETVYWFEKMNI